MSLRAKLIKEHEGYLTPKAAAEFLGVDVNTLSQWRFRLRHKHPGHYELPYVRLGTGRRGGRCFYRKADLISFMESRLCAR